MLYWIWRLRPGLAQGAVVGQTGWRRALEGFSRHSRGSFLWTEPCFGERSIKAMAGAGESKTGQILAGGEEPGAGAEVGKTMIPGMENPVVIRTEFSDQAAWEAIVTAIRTPTPGGFNAYVEFLDDPAFQGLTTTQVLALVSEEYTIQHGFLMIVDHTAITEPEHPVVVVNLYEDEADEEAHPPAAELRHVREFRAVPASIQSIENNLSIATMNFEDFADSVSEDGVFRRFADPTKWKDSVHGEGWKTSN